MKYFKHVFICLLIIILINLSIHAFQKNIIEGATQKSITSTSPLSSNPYQPNISCFVSSNISTIKVTDFYFNDVNNNTNKFYPIFFLQNNYDNNIVTQFFLDNKSYNIDCNNVLYVNTPNSKNYFYKGDTSNQIKCYLNKSGTFIDCLRYFNESFTETTSTNKKQQPKPQIHDISITYNSNDITNKNNRIGVLNIIFKNDNSDTNKDIRLRINIKKNNDGRLNKFETILIDYLIQKQIINKVLKDSVKFVILNYVSYSYSLSFFNMESIEFFVYKDFTIDNIFNMIFGLFSMDSNTASIASDINSIDYVKYTPPRRWSRPKYFYYPLYSINSSNNSRFSCGYIEDPVEYNKSYLFISQNQIL